MKNVIVFDGACGFCNKTVLFFAKQDNKNEFLFMSNESREGIVLLEHHGVKLVSDDTILVFIDNKMYTKSKAIKQILLKLRNLKTLGALLSLVPYKISDFVYDFISKHRRSIISKQECQIPEQHIRDKFILK